MVARVHHESNFVLFDFEKEYKKKAQNQNLIRKSILFDWNHLLHKYEKYIFIGYLKVKTETKTVC